MRTQQKSGGRSNEVSFAQMKAQYRRRGTFYGSDLNTNLTY